MLRFQYTFNCEKLLKGIESLNKNSRKFVPVEPVFGPRSI